MNSMFIIRSAYNNFLVYSCIDKLIILIILLKQKNFIGLI